MDIPNIYLEPATYEVDFDDLHEVRTAVFVVEQQIPPELEFDELDRQCHHVIARDEHGLAIGTGRISPTGQLGRMAVLKDWRRQGIGASLLRALIEKARKLGLVEVSANAQLTAVGFYEKFGFIAQGETFLEADIPHRAVRLKLEPLEQTGPRTAKVREPSVEAKRLETVEAAVAATQELIKRARRQLCIYSRDLEYGLYGDNETIEALKKFVLDYRNSEVQIILQEPANLQGQTHPLLELAQKLTSHFLIRTPVETDDIQNQSAFVVNDNDGYLFRLFGNRYEGHWSPILPARNRQLRDEFERVWQRSRPCTEFRALGL